MIRSKIATLLAIAFGYTASHFSSAAGAATYHAIYSFGGGSDGAEPYAA